MSEIRELREYLNIIRKYSWIIILVTLTVPVLTGLISYRFLTPLYEAKTQLLVNGTSGGAAIPSQGEIESNIMLIETYRVVMKSPVVMDAVAKQLGWTTGIEELIQKVSVDNVKNTLVLSVFVRDSNPKQAARFANTVATVFKEKITSLMKVDNVSIISPAPMDGSSKQVWPRPLLNIGISFAFALILSIGAAFLMEYFDFKLKTEQAIEQFLGLPVLGTVPVIKRNQGGTLHHAKI